MNNPALTQQIKALFLCGVGLLLALWFGWNIGAENYQPILLAGVFLGVAAFALYSGRFFWVIAIASASLAGSFPFLGGSFTPFQGLMLIGLTKFLIEDVVLRRRSLTLGNRIDLFLILGFMAIITLHALRDRLGMRFLGSNIWGGRNYINVYVGFVAFFVVQSMPVKPKIWAKLPYAILAVVTFDLVISLVTTIFPSTIYVIYPFYSAVSRTGVESLFGGPDEAARLGAVGNFGVTVMTLILSSMSLGRILHPSNFFRAMAFIGGFLAVLLSSFRTAVFNTAATILIAGFRDLKMAALALLPLLALILFGLSFLNSEVIALPKAIQRSLTFMPGEWDTKMKLDAKASNDFRQKVWTVFVSEYFPAHPWIGRGFGFRSQVVEQSSERYNPNWDREVVEVGNIHNGFLAALDAFGSLGTIFFIVWNIRLLIRAVRVPINKPHPAGKALPFLALSLGASIICYWLSAASIGSFLPTEFALAGVFLQLLRQSEHGTETHSQAVKEEIIHAPATV